MEQFTVEQMQQLWKVVDRVESMDSKVDEMYSAIVGNKRMGQEGMAERLQRLEVQVEEMDKQIQKAKGWLGGALFVGGIFGSGVTLFIKFLISKI